MAKDVRDEMWNRFREASSEVNKRHQAFFEERKKRELDNENAKTALCEDIESINTAELKTYSAWNQASARIIKAQEEWKKLGFASRKTNNALFTRFRAACDAFFDAKAVFFNYMKEELAKNLRHKTALCEEAESLKDSTDWKATSDRLIELQKEWKTIGAVPKKHSDALWQHIAALKAKREPHYSRAHLTFDSNRLEDEEQIADSVEKFMLMVKGRHNADKRKQKDI